MIIRAKKGANYRTARFVQQHGRRWQHSYDGGRSKFRRRMINKNHQIEILGDRVVGYGANKKDAYLVSCAQCADAAWLSKKQVELIPVGREWYPLFKIRESA